MRPYSMRKDIYDTPSRFLGIDGWLDFEEDALAVEYVKEYPAEGDVAEGLDEWLHVVGHDADETAEYFSVGVGKTDEFLRQVNGDGVKADNLEEERPTLPAAHVDDVVEKREHQHGICSDNADK